MGPKVAVVGLGTMGAQCLWQLSRRGIDASGYETYVPGHGRGAAGGDNRLFRMIELEDPRFSPVVARADELWDEQQRLSPRATNITGVLITGEVGVSFVEIELDGKPRVFANGIDRPRRLADKLSRHRRGCAVVGLRLISLASDPTNVSIRPGNGGPPVSEDANQPSEADAGEDVRNP